MSDRHRDGDGKKEKLARLEHAERGRQRKSESRERGGTKED